ncbi:MAG: murI, partial [Acidimicrobiaceae bacterium]|nr:murI [Acidimicrobiaceae bacterium]
LSPLTSAGVDTLLLGCTHYPYLARTIGDVMGRDVVLVSSAEETAFDVRSVLLATGLQRTATGTPLHRFFSSGDITAFAALGRQLLGDELVGAERIELGGPEGPAAGGRLRAI